MQVVEVLAVDKEVKHIVTLAAYLQTGLHPVKFCLLEEFCALKRFEEILLVVCLGLTPLQLVQDPAFQ
jgi:hypothetical protein